MNSPEKFATSLVSLALVRKGYVTSKDVPYRDQFRADILAVGKDQDKREETFIVEVKAIRGRQFAPEQVDILREQYRSDFDIPVYFALFIDSDSVLMVDDELHKRMLFSDEEIRLEVIPQEIVAADSPSP
ncbi:hypothetical protein [Rugamonas sp.]|uniref:hypothetical protein n=1 Tax=Rugamonas sp. TaxID=1926287 RepID=UPI0025FCD302|nr:hypothetical protein [Rugamonas sp.]